MVICGHGCLLMDWQVVVISSRWQWSRPLLRGRLFPAVPGAGTGQPLVEPDGLVSVGPRGLELDDQIDIGNASSAKVRPP